MGAGRTGGGIDALSLRLGPGVRSGACSTTSSSKSTGPCRCVRSADGMRGAGLLPRRARAEIIPNRSGSMSCAIGSVVTEIGRWVVRNSSNERPKVAGRPKVGRMGGSSMKSPRISGRVGASVSTCDAPGPGGSSGRSSGDAGSVRSGRPAASSIRGRPRRRSSTPTAHPPVTERLKLEINPVMR